MADGTVKDKTLHKPEEALASAKAELKLKPSAYLWEVEVRRIINGDRESDLLRLGGADEYVDKILDLSADRAVAETSFHAALRNVIQAWRPGKVESKEYLAALLDLVAAYEPESGAPKVLSFLDRLIGTNYGEDLQASGGYGAHSDLYLKGLVALERCYLRAPKIEADEFLNFKSYVSLLNKTLESPRYGGYAAARLIELQVLAFDSYELGTLIEKRPDSLNELLSLVFTPAREARLGQDLSKVLKYALDAGDTAYKTFVQILKRLGGHLDMHGGTLVVRLDYQESRPIELDQEVVTKYLGLLQRREIGLDRIHSLLTELPRQTQARDEIAAVLDRCSDLGAEAVDQFEAELEKYDATVIYKSGALRILLSDGSSYPFHPSDETMLKYACYELWTTHETNIDELERKAKQIVEDKIVEALTMARSSGR